MLNASVTGYLAARIDDSKADNLIPVFHKLVYQPFQRELRIVVLICSAEEGARMVGVCIIFVF